MNDRTSARLARNTSLEGKTDLNCHAGCNQQRNSDVLFRHCKGHAQNAMNRMKSNEQQHQEQDYRHNSLDDSQTPRPVVSLNGTGQTPVATPQMREDSNFSPMTTRRESHVPQLTLEGQYNAHLSPTSHTRQPPRIHPLSPGEDRIEALINAAQQLEPSGDTPWRSPSPMIIARPEGNHLQNRHHHESMGPPIDPAMEALSFSPVAHVSSLDQWAFELVQSNNPIANRTPADALQTWLFPLEGDIHAPHGPHHLGVDGFFDPDFPKSVPENQASPSGSSVSIASRVPRERFQRVQICWPSRNQKSSRLMPDLWQNLVTADCSNILSEIPAGVIDTPLSERERRNSRWGLDEECRSILQDALNNVPQLHPTRSESYGDTASSSGDAAGSPSVEGFQFPPAEILDIALEMYLYYFHPTLAIIHIPTFSAKHAPRPLLLCMCLIGLSILGTAGATKFVTRSFPVRNILSKQLKCTNHYAGCSTISTRRASIVINHEPGSTPANTHYCHKPTRIKSRLNHRTEESDRSSREIVRRTNDCCSKPGAPRGQRGHQNRTLTRRNHRH